MLVWSVHLVQHATKSICMSYSRERKDSILGFFGGLSHDRGRSGTPQLQFIEKMKQFQSDHWMEAWLRTQWKEPDANLVTHIVNPCENTHMIYVIFATRAF